MNKEEKMLKTIKYTLVNIPAQESPLRPEREERNNFGRTWRIKIQLSPMGSI